MSITKIFFLLTILVSSNASAQYQIQQLTEQKGVSIRSLAVPSDKVIWASGSKGMIAKSIDEGKSFIWTQVKGYEQRDFRAMHAWDDKEAIIVAVASPAIILKTKDGGASWVKVYENNDTAMFLDAIHFKDNDNGFIIGDPIDGTIFLLSSKDKGDSWTRTKSQYFSSTLAKGEAFFASSNSNMVYSGESLFMVTGGLKSRLWMNGVAFDLPIIQGTSSTGANSIAISPDQKKLIIVGGDFTQDKIAEKNIAAFKVSNSTGAKKNKNSIKLETEIIPNPNGYKSSVEFINNHLIITCGTSGVDVYNNGESAWKTISTAPYHVVKSHASKAAAFLAGSGGRISYVYLK